MYTSLRNRHPTSSTDITSQPGHHEGGQLGETQLPWPIITSRELNLWTPSKPNMEIPKFIKD
jgi:hypothetical protein